MPRLERFSVSQLTTYLMCPRLWKFRYLERRTPEKRSANLAFGTAVHGAIEWWWKKRIEGEEPDEGSVLRIFRAEWHSEGLSPVRLDLEGKPPEHYLGLGEALLRLFIERFAKEPPPDAVEEGFEADLHDPKTGEVLGTKLVGFIDARRNGSLVELKTAARKSDPLSTWGMQLAAYSWAMRTLGHPGRRFMVVELIKTKEPRIEVCEVEVTERDEDWFLEVASEVLGAIESEAFPPSPGWQCSGCEYRGACREGSDL